jgi:hypothetical protein
VGSVGSQVLEYETAYVNAAGERSGPQPGHRLSEEQLIGQLKRCATALGGIRSSAERKYIVTNKPKKVSLGSPQFVVVDACSMARIDSITPGNVSHFKAILALRKHVRENPSDRRRYTVAPSYQAA